MKGIAISFCLAFVALAAGANPAYSSPLPDSASIADVAARAVPSVVNVSTKTEVKTAVSPFRTDPFFSPWRRQRPQQPRYGQSLGSGVVVSKDGYVLTNNHVVKNAKEIKVALSDGREFTAKLVGTDPASDLAVLKLKGKVKNLRPMDFGNSRSIRLGEIVVAIGNPFGVGQAVTMGIISAKGRGNMGIVDYEDFIQTDAAINPGNSGGALVNMKGELIGINTAILSRSGGYQGIGFAIPTHMAEPIMKSLISKGRVSRGYMGISMHNVDAKLKKALGLETSKGVIVTDVEKNSPAKRAGIRENDLIVSVDGRKTKDMRSLRNAVAGAGSGNSIAVELYRKNKKKRVTVILEERPKDDALAQKMQGQQGQGKVPAANKFGVALRPPSKKLRSKYRLPRGLNKGLVIVYVKPQSLAAAIGLSPGDTILKINGEEVSKSKQFNKLYKNSEREVAILVHRDGGRLWLSFTK